MRRRITIIGLTLAIGLLMTLSVSALARPSNFALTFDTPVPPVAQIGSEPVLMRTGPGENFPVIGELSNTNARIIGYSEDRSWLLVRYGSGQGWLQTSQVTINTTVPIPVVTYTSPTPYITPTYNSADLSPTAPAPITYLSVTPTYISASQSPTVTALPTNTFTPSPTRPMAFPTLTPPYGEPTSTQVGRVAIALRANPAYSRIITDDDMRLATDIIRARLSDYYVRDLNLVTSGDTLYIEFNDNGNMGNLLLSLEQQGTLEIVDIRDFTLEFRQNLLGSTVYTTGYQRAYPLDDGLVNPYTNDAFQTIVAVEYPSLSNVYGDDGVWYVDLTLNFENSERLLIYTFEHVGSLMGIVLDGQLISMPLIERPMIDFDLINDFAPFSASEAQRLANILRRGALPFPMEIIDYTIVN